MPTKKDLGTLVKQAQSRWLAFDKEERKKRDLEQRRLQKVDSGLDQGRSWQEISKSTGLGVDKVREYSERTRPGYGIKPGNMEKLTKNLKDIGYSVATGVKDYAVDLGRDVKENVEQTVGSVISGERKGPGAEEIIRRQEQAAALPKDIQERAKNISSQDNLALLDLVKQGKSKDELRKFVSEANKRKAEADKKTIGTAAEVASLALDAPGLVQAARGGVRGVIGATAQTAAGGALGAAGSEARTNPDASLESVATQAGIGAGTGVGVGVATGTLGALLKKGRQPSPAVVQRVTSAPETRVIEKELGNLDSAIIQAEQSGNRSRVRALTGDKDFLEEEAVRNVVAVESANALEMPTNSAFSATGKTKTSKLAAGTEQKAISEELTKGFGDLPTFQGMNMEEQAARVVDAMNQDYDLAKRIALGEVEPPVGVAPGSFYKGVEARAAREGDVELLERLATESTIPKQASLQGQQIASLAYRDPESPVTAFRTIEEARKKTSLAAISPEEAQQVVSLSQDVANAKNAIGAGGDRLEYGRARVAYDDYVNELVAAANKKTVKDALRHPVDTAINAAGVSKSLRASLDNSALLRQGWKTLFTHPGTWAKNSAKTFSDFARTVGGKETINEVRADIVSRPNSLNGMYKKMGVDVFGLKKEEAFPSSLPEKIPGAGRFFKASDAAYTGFQQRTRADLADKYLEIAQKSGVDLTSKKELQAIGKLVNSLTGRGNLGRTGERAAKVLNNVFFSPRLLKSNIDVLTGHNFQSGVTPFVRKRAARNLLQIAVGSAAALKLAQEVTGGKVEWDPRSSNFGKVKIGDTRFDLSGGMASIATLGARIGTRSSKSSTTGEVKKLNSGKSGSQSTMDTIYNFFENKTSPAVSVLRDYLKGEDFEGNKPTAQSTAKNLTLPLIVASYNELRSNPRAADVLPSLMAEALGVSVNTYGLASDWNASNAKRVAAFKKQVGEDRFKKASEDFNQKFSEWYDKVASSQKFWGLPQEKREGLVTGKRDALTEDVMEAVGYKKPRRRRRDRSTEKLIDELRKF